VDKSDIKNLFQNLKIKPNKNLGQNFLINREVLFQIAKEAKIIPKDKIIEIGPGLGVLTKELLDIGAYVTAIEFDPQLMTILRKQLGNYPKLKLIQGDALDEIPKINIKDKKIIANLPYQITSPFFRKVLGKNNLPSKIVVMVQKEVAERITAKPHSSKRGFLSVMVQLYGKPKIISIVNRESFYPVPKVESAILSLKVKPLNKKTKKQLLLKMVQAGFSQKRKKIRNSIAASLQIEAADAEKIIKKAGINPDNRAEDLEINDWIKLLKYFSKYFN